MSMIELAITGFVDKLVEMKAAEKRKEDVRHRRFANLMMAKNPLAEFQRSELSHNYQSRSRSRSKSRVQSQDDEQKVVGKKKLTIFFGAILKLFRRAKLNLAKANLDPQLANRIDSFCAKLFPVMFLLFNIAYWGYYINVQQ